VRREEVPRHHARAQGRRAEEKEKEEEKVNWRGEAIWEAVAPLVPGFTVEVLPELDSTNTELMRRARAGRAEPVLLVAERQTAGRGRLGRGWTSAEGDSLTFSLGLPLAPADWAGLSLAVGVAIAEQLHPRVRLKWPNDLWVDDRKLAGILIETASTSASAAPRYAVIGVGVNVRPPRPDGLSMPPACVEELVPGLDAPGVLARIAHPLVQSVLAFQTFGFAPFRARFDARDALRDRAVALSDGTTGTAHGITESGGLLVHTAAGMTTVTSAEVSVRPCSA
jgi:BirA family biotin operon repressor/biotin-[acetyl-CoA-carboxylase] ligase